MAVSLAAELHRTFGTGAELVRSAKRVFRVEFQGRLLFSQGRKGRLPEEGEVADLIKRTAILKDLAHRPHAGDETEQ
jgi:hypothetical protein